ncbi:MAG: GNAT family N-acetyltransferase [Planctomycetes bacterium]|nr:GNAT family N-acetyltransferase [Planctomycetota bacterium]MCP4770661.1 GNAT family N-acetyltransferase [Planctomycetota bacterium]MCP4860286.1 GNAT family N-acetyltransferase [Planctomycetota bacterium]
MSLEVREAVDEDSEGIIALIDSCYREYPPNILDVDLEEPELRAPASRYPAFWVIEDEVGQIVGCIALQVREPQQRIELKKCYVHKSQRGAGLGRDLVQQVEDWARAQGCPEVELWTDTRFKLAHRVYTALGYEPSGRTRDLHDLSQTTEFHFLKNLG